MYCQFPVGGASRSSLMNGLYHHGTGDPENMTKGGVGLRTQKWRYTEQGTGTSREVDLYDLVKDPQEFINVADQSAYAATLKTLGGATRPKKARDRLLELVFWID